MSWWATRCFLYLPIVRPWPFSLDLIIPTSRPPGWMSSSYVGELGQECWHEALYWQCWVDILVVSWEMLVFSSVVDLRQGSSVTMTDDLRLSLVDAVSEVDCLVATLPDESPVSRTLEYRRLLTYSPDLTWSITRRHLFIIPVKHSNKTLW